MYIYVIKPTLFWIFIVAIGHFYECIWVNILLPVVTFHWCYCSKKCGCELMCFAFRPWILSKVPLNIVDWSTFPPCHLFSCLTPSYFVLCYRQGHVVRMCCLLDPNLVLANFCGSRSQWLLFLQFGSPKDDWTTFENLLYNFNWLVVLAMDCF